MGVLASDKVGHRSPSRERHADIVMARQSEGKWHLIGCAAVTPPHINARANRNRGASCGEVTAQVRVATGDAGPALVPTAPSLISADRAFCLTFISV